MGLHQAAIEMSRSRDEGIGGLQPKELLRTSETS